MGTYSLREHHLSNDGALRVFEICRNTSSQYSLIPIYKLSYSTSSNHFCCILIYSVAVFEEQQQADNNLWYVVMFSTANSSVIALAGTKGGARILDIPKNKCKQVTFDVSVA